MPAKFDNGVGEGIVVKNYNFRNRHGRIIWAKVVTNQFKEKHNKHQPTNVKMGVEMEQRIVEHFVTPHLIDKVYAKLTIDSEFENRMIPQLLNTVFYDLVREESWAIVKKFKNPTIDFRRLQGLTAEKIKQHKQDIFGYNIKAAS